MATNDVELSSPDKVLWPEGSITKADLADYYHDVRDRLLPHLAGRAVTLNHHPRGVDRDGFMRKDLASHAPAFVGRWTTHARTARRDVDYALIDSPEALRWCAGQNVTELHACLFRVDRPDRLDTLVIDLDPSESSVTAVVAAPWVREVLDEIGLRSGVKTSGGRGLHVLVPVERRYATDELRALVEGVAAECVRRHPDELTTRFAKDERGGRLFVDCTRVGIGATLIAAWSPRARSIPTVSTPLSWDEVGPDLDVRRLTQATVRDRPDPLVEVAPQRIESAARALAAVGGSSG
ncbi:non-homologous end-joining DNA ligase [Ilumatobacter sp.]|uniref:non-homologous end-joining DNA ligase n=1 Tax=Ilumatobacter sp. TaxID=1967498 RepID=UPI003B529485